MLSINQGKMPVIPDDKLLLTKAARFNTAPINYLINDPTTPQLVKSVPVPDQINNPSFNVMGYQGGGFETHTAQGQAASVMVTITNSLKNINNSTEKKLAKWSGTRNLLVLPRAGKTLNAFYNRKSLAFFYDKDPSTGQDVFASDSSDIVSHELGHAILDAYRPDLWSVAYLETWAFHEAFGDINALLSFLCHDEAINHILNETGGNLDAKNAASRIADQFGQVVWLVEGKDSGRDPLALRNLINNFKYSEPSKLKKKGSDAELLGEPHNFSRIMSGAIYQIFVMMYKDHLTKGVQPIEAVKKARDIVSRYIVRAIQNAPVQPAFFESIAKTILWCDWSTPERPYHNRMWDIFVERNIIKPVSLMSNKLMYSHRPMVKPLTTVKINNNLTGVRALNYNPFHNLEVVVSSQSEESVDAAKTMFNYLVDSGKLSEEGTPFVVSDGKLVRSHFACCGGSYNLSQPSKYQPEFHKPYKPQNNAGCGCGCGKKIDPEIAARPTVKRGCFIRYQVAK